MEKKAQTPFTRFYKIFTHPNPAQLDSDIDKFIAEGRKLVRVDRTMSIKEVHQQMPKTIPGMQLTPGAIAVEVQMSFYALVVYEGNILDKAAHKQSQLGFES